MATVFIGMGSNVGDRAAHLERARAALDALPDTRVTAMSRIYETAPVGPVDQGTFLNAAACIETDLPPTALLDAMNRIEQEAGRTPLSQRTHWGPRELDLDILLYDDQVIETDRLQIPHPSLHERWFVLKPLADVGPQVVHPTLKRTVAELLDAVEQEQGESA